MSGEFDFIQYIKKRHGLKHIGDDCAVLPKDAETDMVISADMLVENIDFRTDWATPEEIGHKSLAVSLSDISAMGAVPKWAMLSIGAPKGFWNGGDAERFFEGYMNLAKKFGVELVGGDISSSENVIVIDSTVCGEVSRGNAVMRGGASPGDGIFVAGTLGGAAAGLKILESGRKSDGSGTDIRNSELIKKQLAPVPLTSAGIEIGTGHIASAMIDISDGLSSDLHHLCDSGGVGAIVHADALPIDPHLENETDEERLRLALTGGEDLALLFTATPANRSAAERIGARIIGEITYGREVRIVIDGGTLPLMPEGFRHF